MDPLDRAQHRFTLRTDHADAAPRRAGQRAYREEIEWVGHRDDEMTAFELERHDSVRARELDGDQRRRVVLRLELVVGEVWNPGVSAERLEQRGVGEVAERDEGLAELLARRVLNGQRLIELLAGDESGVEQRVTQPSPHCHRTLLPRRRRSG